MSTPSLTESLPVSSSTSAPVFTPRRWLRAYLGDYVSAGVLVAFLAAWHFFASPVVRSFDPTDPRLGRPYSAKETVPTWLLFVLALIPAVAAPLAANLFVSRSFIDAHAAVLCVAETTLLVLASADFAKFRVGELRPDFLQRCAWNALNETCTGDPELIANGRMSFFSGHSALICAAAMFLSLYAFGKLRGAHQQQQFVGISIRFEHVLCLGGVWAVAFFVASSRVTDNRHHPGDVAFGSFFGAAIAIAVYSVHFPLPWAAALETPWKPWDRLPPHETHKIPAVEKPVVEIGHL